MVPLWSSAGAIMGVIVGETKKFGNKDEFFKSLVSSKFNEYKQVYDDSLTHGGDVAGSREKNTVSI